MPKLLSKVNLPRYSSAPSTPSEADLYYNTSDDKIYVYTGAAWVEVGSGAGGSGVFYQSSEPSSPSDGDIWIDSDDEVASVTSVTDSTSTTSSTVAASATAVKSAYDLANGAIPKTLTTTTGDIIYASSANTPARLGIGTDSQVLSVSGGVPAWTTPAAGGGMTLIATATPSGATSLAFTSIPGTYKHLKIVYRDVYFSTTTSYLGLRFNNDTSSVYDWGGLTNTSNTSNAATIGIRATQSANTFGDGDVRISVVPGGSSASGANSASGVIDIFRYTELEHRVVTFEATAYDNVNGRLIFVQGNGRWRNTADAITSVNFIRSSSQTITGTFYLYGVS